MDSKLTEVIEFSSEKITDLYNHGWGEMSIKVLSLKDNTVRIEVICGLSHHFFIKKSTFKDII